MPRSSVLWRSGSFSRTSFFGVSSLVFFHFVFVAGRAAGAPRNHCGARRDDGETPGAGLKEFCYSSLFFVIFPSCYSFVKTRFCRMRWCPISFGWRSSWRWPATSQLLPFFRLPTAQYISTAQLKMKMRANRGQNFIDGEVSIRSLRSKDARILGDMEDGWTWWTEWQVTWVIWKTHTHTHQVSSHAAALWDQPVREPPAADNPEVLLSSFWLQRNGFSFAHFLQFFWGRCNDLKYFCLFLDAFSLLWLARLDKKRDRHVEDVYKLRRKTVAPQWNWRSHVIHASLIWFYHVFPFAKVFSKQLHFCDAFQAETGEVLNFFRGVIKTGM